MISIVTINKDNKEGLRKTIESVISQTYFSGIEYIIIDGASTDGSVQVIKEYEDKINFWSSKPDKGIYDAMNKGLKYATGDYVLFLNSGDYLENEKVIENVMPYLDGKNFIVYGNQLMKGHKKLVKLGAVAISVHSNEEALTLKEYPDRVNEDYFKNYSLPHQSTFIKTTLFKTKKYDESYKIISDMIFLREAIVEKKKKYKHIPITVSVFNMNGISAKHPEIIEKERNDYFKKIDK